VFQSENADTALHWLAHRRAENSTDQMLVCEWEGLAADDI